MLLPTIPRIFIYIVPHSFGDIITGGHLVYGLSFHQITQSCWEMRMLSWNHGLGRQRLNSSIFYLGVSEKSEKYMTIQTQNLYFIRWFHDAEVGWKTGPLHGEIIYGGTRWIEDDCSATFSEYIFLFPACLMISHWLTKNAELNSVF